MRMSPEATEVSFNVEEAEADEEEVGPLVLEAGGDINLGVPGGLDLD